MLILGIESSARAASAALCRDGELLGQYYQCAGLTHSRTLLPMAEELLRGTDTALADIDGVAVSAGVIHRRAYRRGGREGALLRR